jgi:hypothetical protein
MGAAGGQIDSWEAVEALALGDTFDVAISVGVSFGVVVGVAAVRSGVLPQPVRPTLPAAGRRPGAG